LAKSLRVVQRERRSPASGVGVDAAGVSTPVSVHFQQTVGIPAKLATEIEFLRPQHELLVP
jgi:hypothetical protein